MSMPCRVDWKSMVLLELWKWTILARWNSNHSPTTDRAAVLSIADFRVRPDYRYDSVFSRAESKLFRWFTSGLRWQCPFLSLSLQRATGYPSSTRKLPEWSLLFTRKVYFVILTKKLDKVKLLAHNRANWSSEDDHVRCRPIFSWFW